jgi:hypothetical protein
MPHTVARATIPKHIADFGEGCAAPEHFGGCGMP